MTDPIELRPVDSDELDVIADRLLFRAFGHTLDPASHERRRPLRRAGHFLLARRQGEDAGTAGAYDYQLSLPGGTAAHTVAVRGITMVGVRPDHRRSGVLSALMERMLDDAAAAGCAAAVLYASESTIYGRYGFGVVAPRAEAEVAVRRAAFRDGTPLAPGRVRAHDLADEGLRDLLVIAYDRARFRRPGELSRSDAGWQVRLTPLPRKEDRLFVVHHDLDGQADGYASYTVTDAWGAHGPEHRLRVEELVAASDAVELSLWRAVFDHDLVQRVSAYVPVDWIVPDALADPWAARLRWVGHSMWARLLDVCGAMAARQYRVPGTLRLQVLDDRPDVAGRYVLHADGQSAQCRRDDGPADLRLGSAVLARLWLGGDSASRLARAGRIVEETAGAAVRADLMFGWDPAPFTTEEF